MVRRTVVLVGALLGVLVAPSAALAQPAAPSARSVLAEDRYRFCHDKDYQLTREEHAWCPLVGTASETCPALPKACEGQAVERPSQLDSRGGMSRGERAPKEDEAHKAEPARAPRKAERPDRHDDSEGVIMLPDMSSFARVLLLVLVAVFARGSKPGGVDTTDQNGKVPDGGFKPERAGNWRKRISN